jgi:hypothetical protein
LIDAEWSKDHKSVIGDSHLILHLRLMLDLDNLILGGALRWKVEDHWLGKSESVVWKADTSKVVAPAYVG